MRNSYDRSSDATREDGLRRLGKLTWRTAQLGALATVGVATLFARTAPAQTASQTAPAAKPAAATSSPSPTPAASRRAKPTPASPAASHPAAQAAAPSAAPSSAPRPGADRLARAGHQGAHPGAAHHRAGRGADHRGARADCHKHITRRKLVPTGQRPVMPGQCTFAALGTFATLLVTDPAVLASARGLLTAELAAIDAACSRFRSDSELSRACSANGRPVAISSLFVEALEVALTAARLTDGDVDPTCGQSLAWLGYDRDFALARQDTSPVSLPPVLGGGWRRYGLTPRAGRCRSRPGCMLDLGATAKALAADRAATAIAAATGCGVLVNLGGDISVAGRAPEDGWLVGVADDARFDTTADSVRIRQSVLISGGGLATSSVLGRSWQRGGVTVHHIIAPGTGLPARSCWRTVTVAAKTCVDANIAATAAIVRGERATNWLEQLRLPTRLVRHDGSVVTVAGWPERESTA